MGITSDAYSFPYIARWSDGDTDTVRTTAQRVITCARQILTAAGLAPEKGVPDDT